MANPAHYYHIVKKPLVTEKTTVLQDIRGQYAFRVHPDTNKREIKKAIETLFEVHVERVNIVSMPGKIRRILGRPGRTPEWKKAYVKLRQGETIEIV